MAEVTREALRLLVVPDKRTLLSTAGVSMTATSEAGPRPGVVSPSQSSSLAVFGASGTLDGELDDLELGVARAGGPGSVEVRWRHAGEGMRSWDPPTAIAEWEFLDRSTVAGKYAAPHACRLTSGRVVVVVTDAGTAITCWRQLSTGKWASSTVATVASSVAAIAELATGRLLCVWTSGGSTTTQLQMGYSDDGGATWTTGSSACLDEPLDVLVGDVTRLRMAVLGSDLLVLLWGAGIDLYQLASSDQGASFDVVESGVTGISGRASPDIAVHQGVALVGCIGVNADDASRSAPLVLQLLTARASIEDADEVWAYGPDASNWATSPAETSSWATTELALVVDDDGIAWLYGRDDDAGATKETIITCSVDGGVTWRKPWRGSGNGLGLAVASWGVATTYLTGLCAVMERSRVLLLHTAVAGTATDDDSLMAAYLGGWTTLGLPHDHDLPRMPDVGGWDTTWLTFEKPANMGWTLATAGAPTEVLGSTGLLLTCAGGESETYTLAGYSIAGATDAGTLVGLQVRVDSGATTGVVLRVSDGAADFQIRLEITATTLRIYDVEAGAYIAAATSTTAAANGVVVLLCLDAPSGYGGNVGRVRCSFRAAGNYTLAGPTADREWTSITGSATLTAGAVTTSAVTWGQVLAGAGVSCWRWLGLSGGVQVAGRDGLADPTRGRIVPTRASPVHLVSGLRLGCVSGPALVGETWTHATAHDYPVEALDVEASPSPRRTWRSTDESQQDITITLSGGWRSGDLVAVYLGGANFRTATLYRGSGLTKVADLDLGYGGLDYTRARDVVYPAMSGTAGPWYIREGALDGGTFALDGAVRRRIRHAREGLWPNNAIGIKPKALLELLDVEDGTDPASGAGELWLPQGLFVTTLLQSTDLLTLRIPAQATADGYLELGTLMLGRACAFGLPYDWGHADEALTAVDLRTLRGGGRRARRLHANRRALELGWPNGSDLSGLYGGVSIPDYVSVYTGGAAHGTVPATLPLVRGLLDELGGASIPGVVCRRIPTQGSAPTATAPIRVLDPAMLLYGRLLTETWRADHVIGEEGTDPGEVLRGGVLRFEQEL